MLSLVTLQHSFNTSDSSFQTATSLIPQALHKWDPQAHPGARTRMSREDAGARVRGTPSRHCGRGSAGTQRSCHPRPRCRERHGPGPFPAAAGPGCRHGGWRGRQLALTPQGHRGAPEPGVAHRARTRAGGAGGRGRLHPAGSAARCAPAAGRR